MAGEPIRMKLRRPPPDGERIKLRLWLWAMAVVFIPLAILLTADLLDGSTQVLWHRRITAWSDPGLFAATVGFDLVCVAIAAIFWLAVAGDWNQQWLPPRLRAKPLGLLAILSLLTAGTLLFGVELVSGDLTVRRLGHVTVDGTPLRFAWLVFLYGVFCVLIAIGWYAVKKSWSGTSYGIRKAPLDEPEKRSSM
jgi:hypothetical protein